VTLILDEIVKFYYFGLLSKMLLLPKMLTALNIDKLCFVTEKFNKYIFKKIPNCQIDIFNATKLDTYRCFVNATLHTDKITIQHQPMEINVK